jgi:catechol 2,3-dioxygenase-like lactoylglutathione lyase family enzyme
MANQFRLSGQSVIAFVATRDPERAKEFYRDTLGLRLVGEELPFALVFDLRGIMLRVTIVKDLKPAGYTILGWQVPDIAAGAKALQKAGVQFERYPGMDQDESGIWTSPSGAKVAWFKDPDGNTLSISEH